MEWLTIILSSLLAAISPTGLILDRLAENKLRSQVEAVEQLAVRIDNVPSYQVLQGKVERVRLASRGIQPIPDLRIDTVDLETDAIDVDLSRLQQGKSADALRQPLQAAIHVAITEADLNQALRSPKIQARLQQMIDELMPKQTEFALPRFTLLKAHLDFMGANRVQFQVQVQESATQTDKESKTQTDKPETLDLVLEVGLNVVAGRSLELVEPKGTLNGKRLSSKLLKGFAQGLNKKLDLRNLENKGITARLLQFKIEEQQMNLAAFIRLEPAATGKEKGKR
jgi:hypothetical protein